MLARRSSDGASSTDSLMRVMSDARRGGSGRVDMRAAADCAPLGVGEYGRSIGGSGPGEVGRDAEVGYSEAAEASRVSALMRGLLVRGLPMDWNRAEESRYGESTPGR